MLIAGNWKMNGLRADLDVVRQFADLADTHKGAVDVAVGVPHTLLQAAAECADGTALRIGAQDCHHEESGAHTGCVSAPMLRDAGARFTILGHSERRQHQGESDADVKAKAEAALAAGLEIIICVGETEAERDTGKAEAVVTRQLTASLAACEAERLTIAYEPVWAIGTGRTPTVDDVAAMHGRIRSLLTERWGSGGKDILILYGGSMNASNAGELLAVDNVEGGLVGGASLTEKAFAPIVEAAAGLG